MLVVDASALVDVLARTERGTRVEGTMRGADMAAPELLDVEVLSALRRLVRADVVDPPAADRAASLLGRLPLMRVSHAFLSRRAWELRDRVRIADAFYVACAELVGEALLTTDARLGAAPLPGLTVTVVS